jgi:hypothetical protein
LMVPGAGIESRLWRDFSCGSTGRPVQYQGILSRNNAKLKSQFYQFIACYHWLFLFLCSWKMLGFFRKKEIWRAHF